MTTTHTLALPDADVVYDVHGPLPPADGRPPLLMIGQPMGAGGFADLAAQFPDRTVVTYDPRGLGRSTRRDGSAVHLPQVQAGDIAALIDELRAGPVEVFASSGGAVTALALVAESGQKLTTVVAHEPPLLHLLPDVEEALQAWNVVRWAYDQNGWGAGMAAFMAMTSWQGEFTDEYFAEPLPEPAAFGMPADDDGSRDDPLLSDQSEAVIRYFPDTGSLRAARPRLVIAFGEESADTLTARTAAATAAALGQDAVVFPSHHGGFMGDGYGQAGQPEAFGRRLREVLDGGPEPA